MNQAQLQKLLQILVLEHHILYTNRKFFVCVYTYLALYSNSFFKTGICKKNSQKIKEISEIEVLPKKGILGGDSKSTAPGHGIAGVDCHVQDGLLKLTGIDQTLA